MRTPLRKHAHAKIFSCNIDNFIGKKYILIFLLNTLIVGARLNRLAEAVLKEYPQSMFMNRNKNCTPQQTAWFILFVLRLNVQVNNFSVLSGRSQRFLGLTSTVESKCVLLKDTTRCRLWGSNPGPLDSESNALPQRHRAPLQCAFGVIHCKDTFSDARAHEQG